MFVCTIFLQNSILAGLSYQIFGASTTKYLMLAPHIWGSTPNIWCWTPNIWCCWIPKYGLL